MDADKQPTDLFVKPIPPPGTPPDLGPGEHQEGHNEDLGLSLSDDDWDALEETTKQLAKEATAERAAKEKVS